MFIENLSKTILDPAAKCAPIKLNLEDNPNVTYCKDILRDPEPNPGGSQASVPQVSVIAPHNVFRNPGNKCAPPQQNPGGSQVSVPQVSAIVYNNILRDPKNLLVSILGASSISFPVWE